MGAIEIIALADAAMAFLKKAIPAIRDQFNNGEVSVEQQAAVRKKYDELRAAGGDAFSGPEYELSGR